MKDVQESSKGDFSESRYFKQLRILAQIRNLDIKFMEAMESITKYFKEERDPLYRRGEAKGKAEGKAEGKAAEAKAIAIEMKKDGMPISQIAKFTKLSEAEIEKL